MRSEWKKLNSIIYGNGPFRVWCAERVRDGRFTGAFTYVLFEIVDGAQVTHGNPHLSLQSAMDAGDDLIAARRDAGRWTGRPAVDDGAAGNRGASGSQRGTMGARAVLSGTRGR